MSRSWELKTVNLEAQKETAAKLIADGYLAKDESSKIVCVVAVFTKEQYDLFRHGENDLCRLSTVLER